MEALSSDRYPNGICGRPADRVDRHSAESGAGMSDHSTQGLPLCRVLKHYAQLLEPVHLGNRTYNSGESHPQMEALISVGFTPRS